MNFSTVFLLLFACIALPAAEEFSPAIPPQPMTAPLAPSATSTGPSSTTDDLLRQLDQQITTRDQHISKLAKQGVQPGPLGQTPRDIPDADAAAATEAIAQHAQARRALRIALDEAVARGVLPPGDVLDRGTVRAKAAQLAPIEASNALAIAACWKDVAAAKDGTNDDVTAGLTALEAVDATQLDDSLRVRHLYLRVWFMAESLRRLPADAAADLRATHIARCRTALNELTTYSPGSPLSEAGTALISVLTVPPTTAAP